jgi:hypothetical protein
MSKRRVLSGLERFGAGSHDERLGLQSTREIRMICRQLLEQS